MTLIFRREAVWLGVLQASWQIWKWEHKDVLFRFLLFPQCNKKQSCGLLGYMFTLGIFFTSNLPLHSHCLLPHEDSKLANIPYWPLLNQPLLNNETGGKGAGHKI